MENKQSNTKYVKAAILLANMCLTSFAFAGDGSELQVSQGSGSTVAIDSKLEVRVDKIRLLNQICVSKGLADVLRPLIDIKYTDKVYASTNVYPAFKFEKEPEAYFVYLSESTLDGTCSVSSLGDTDPFSLKHHPYITVHLLPYCLPTKQGMFNETKYVFNRQNKDHVDLTNSPELIEYPQLVFEKTQIKPGQFSSGIPEKIIELASGIKLKIPKDMKDLEVLYQVAEKKNILGNMYIEDEKNAALVESQLVFNSATVVKCLMNGLNVGAN
ncbi:MAG: hypothetical protein ACXVCP_15580 [Bdellovibrio sp.]